MIGKVLTGRGFRGALEYVAGRPGARRLGSNMEGENPRELAREFGAVRALRPTVKVAVRHIPLRLPPEERLSDAQWRRVVERVLAGLGYTHTPWVAYLHPQEGGGEHLHIVTSGVDTLGRAVDNSFDIRRLIELKGGIERDYGLRVVPAPYGKLAPGEQRVRRPRLGEVRAAVAAGRPSERQELQRVLEAAMRPGRSVSEVMGELERQGVTVTPRVLASGRVTGITYRRGEYEFSGTGLGSDFTWPGLIRRRGLDFDVQRDLPALMALMVAAEAAERARRRRGPGDGANPAAAEAEGSAEGGAHGGVEEGSGGGTPEASGGGAGGPRSQRERTAEQVRRQLVAIGCPRYDVMVLDAEGGGQRHVRVGWAVEQVELAVPWLQHQNAGGGEILVRPAAPQGITVFEAVPAARLAAAVQDGYEPAAVVRGHDGLAEVWLRGSPSVSPRVQELMDAEMGQAFAPTHYPAHPGGYGHLAGFTSPLARRRAGLARAPFVSLVSAPGRPYRRAAALAEECRNRAAREDLERRAAREMTALGGGGRGNVATAPRPVPREVAGLHELLADADRAAERLGIADPHGESGEEVEGRLERLAKARTALAEATVGAMPVDGAVAEGREAAAPVALATTEDGAVAAARRTIEMERQGLAEVLGVRKVPADLSAAAARELARWRGVLETAQASLEELVADGTARPEAVYAARVTVRTVAEELAEAAERLGLEPEHSVRAALATGGDWRSAGEESGRLPEERAAARGPEKRSAGTLGVGAAEGRAARGHGAARGGPERSDEHLRIAYETAAADGVGRRRGEAERALDGREARVRSQWQEAVRAVERASLAIEALEPRVVQEPLPERLAAYDRLVGRLARLEGLQLELERRTVRLADHRLGRDLGRVERELAAAPSDRLLKRYQELLDARWQIAPRLGGGRRPSAGSRQSESGPGASGGRAPLAAQVEEARGLARGAAANLVREPSLATVRAYGRAFEHQRAAEAKNGAQAVLLELRGARRELRAAVAGLSEGTTAGEPVPSAPPERPESGASAEVRSARFRRALLRHQGAEARLAASLDDLEPPVSGWADRLAQVRLRVRLGDLSPDTLSRLQRIVVAGLGGEGMPSGPPPRGAGVVTETARGLGEAAAAWRQSRAALRAGLRALAREPSRAELLALRQAVSSAQAAEAEVGRVASTRGATARLTDGGERSILPVRYFLDHPAMAGRAQRASAAWSAHASERGVSPERIAQMLPRSRQSWLAAPRALSGTYALALAVGVARSLWQHYTQEP